MNVLSLFDGISCGRVALERAGIKVDKYYSSEIDKYSNIISEKNYQDIIRLGDVTKLHGDIKQEKPQYLFINTKYDLHSFHSGGIDLLIGGSPCQGFSFAGKQLNFEDPRSKLFFEFVRILKEVKPKYFLLENVKMKQEYQDIISEQLGVKPIEINSALVSAQNRKRLYWTNIPNITQPEDRHIMLKDIVHELRPEDISILYVPEATKKGYAEIKINDGVDLTFMGSKTRRGRRMEDKCNCLTATNYDYGILEYLNKYIVPFDQTLKILEKEAEKGKVGYFRKDSQANRVYFIHDKAITLCGDAGGGAAKMGQYLFGCITPDRIEKRQNGQRFSEGKKFYTLTAQDKHGILIEGYIRKLTPVECERLQTLPDNYTQGVSDSQRYKMLGNGWTVDVLSHIFKNLK